MMTGKGVTGASARMEETRRSNSIHQGDGTLPSFMDESSGDANEEVKSPTFRPLLSGPVHEAAANT